MRGGARDDADMSQTPGTFFFCFFTCYTKVSIVISHLFSTTTATSNAIGGCKREEGLETHLEPQVHLLFCFFTYYTNVLQLYLDSCQPLRQVIPQEDGNERRGSRHVSSPQVRFLLFFLHTILMFLQVYLTPFKSR